MTKVIRKGKVNGIEVSDAFTMLGIFVLNVMHALCR